MTNRKTIFITGAASGIGRATALHFAGEGWFVGLFDINKDGLSSLQAEIDKNNSCSKVMDVTDLKSVQAAVKVFSDKTNGQMNILHNNAGILKMGLFETMKHGYQMSIVDTNLKGVLNCIHASIALLKKTKDARIINMSSTSAIYGIPELAVYSSTKFAVRALTEALNIEFKKHDIHVCDIMPSYVNSPMITDAETTAYSIEKLGVNLSPERVALTIWQAARKKKIHWFVSMDMKIISFLFWAFPFARRAGIKAITMSSKDA